MFCEIPDLSFFQSRQISLFCSRNIVAQNPNLWVARSGSKINSELWIRLRTKIRTYRFGTARQHLGICGDHLLAATGGVVRSRSYRRTLCRRRQEWCCIKGGWNCLTVLNVLISAGTLFQLSISTRTVPYDTVKDVYGFSPYCEKGAGLLDDGYRYVSIILRVDIATFSCA
jgi:hypothetical protein